MTASLKLSPDLTLPLDAVTQRFGFIGRIGSGKTYAATKLIELMLDAGAQVVAIDPVGKCYGLRVPGTGPGYPITIFGGLHGDVPLESTSGAMIAELVVSRALSCVIDISQFGTDAEKARFCAAFGERFYFLKKQTPSAVFVYLEECQEIVPQHPAPGEQGMLHHWTRMAKLGRNFGIGMGLGSQRPQEVNKKVLNLTECMFTFQLRGKHERDAMRDWITAKDGDVKILDEMPKLANGVAIVDSPQWLGVSQRVKVYEKRTADVSATPKVGEASVAQRPLTSIDLDKIRVAMAATIEKAKAEDPKELRKEIATLKKQLAAAPSKERVVETTIVDERAITRALDQQARAVSKRFEQVERQGKRAVDRLNAILAEVQSAIVPGLEAMELALRTPVAIDPNYVPPTPDRPPVVASRPQVKATQRAAREPVEGVSRGQQKILNALAELAVLGVEQPSRTQLGMFAGYNLTGGTGGQHIADLAKLGLVDIPSNGVVRLTDTGSAAADAVDAPTSLRELHARVLPKLSAGQQKILEHLIAIHPDAISRANLGREVGYNLTGGTGGQHVADLVSLGAAKIPASGTVVASDLLFPDGLS